MPHTPYEPVAARRRGQSVEDLYENYLTGHAGEQSMGALELVLRRDLLPWIPGARTRCLDLGCGQGGLTAYLRDRGYRESYGVDLSEEQVAHAHGMGRAYVVKGDVVDFLAESTGQWGIITAFDFLEHLPRELVLPVLRAVHEALDSGGVFAARVPNGAGPLSGAIQYGDFTHESTFTAGSLRQLSNAAGFSKALFAEAPPVVHGPKSALRRAVWSTYGAVTGRVRGHYVTSNIMAYLTK